MTFTTNELVYESLGLADELRNAVVELTPEAVERAVKRPGFRKQFLGIVHNFNRLLTDDLRKYHPLVYKLHPWFDFLKQLFVLLPKVADAKSQAHLERRLGAPLEVVLGQLRSLVEWWQVKVFPRALPLPKGNSHLRRLPQPREGKMKMLVKELNPFDRLRTLHVFNDVQLRQHASRPVDELLEYDEDEPILASRQYAQGDEDRWPGSIIVLKDGHHRCLELFRRYLKGELSGDELVTAKQA